MLFTGDSSMIWRRNKCSQIQRLLPIHPQFHVYGKNEQRGFLVIKVTQLNLPRFSYLSLNLKHTTNSGLDQGGLGPQTHTLITQTDNPPPPPRRHQEFYQLFPWGRNQGSSCVRTPTSQKFDQPWKCQSGSLLPTHSPLRVTHGREI